MLRKHGFTFMEIIVVLIIIGVVVAFASLNFNTPAEQARALNVRNNLLAIYGAQQNYNNNNGTYCLSANGVCGSLASINTALSLNIQDDGAYLYSCSGSRCTATRTTTNATMVLTLNAAINLSGSGTANPVCNLTANWCP